MIHFLSHKKKSDDSFHILISYLTQISVVQNIPKVFVMKYWDNLSNPVSLELPSGNGSAWKVDLKRLDGQVWFDKGWADLSEFYSLEKGYWLVFGYKGNSKFCVCIFDRTCTEINYPLRKQEMEETDDKEDDFHEDSSDDSIEEQPDDSTCPRKTRKKSSLPCPRPHKKNMTSSSGKAELNQEITQLYKLMFQKSKSEMKLIDYMFLIITMWCFLTLCSCLQ